MSDDPDKVGAVSAGADEGTTVDRDATGASATGPSAEALSESEARGAELREELAITDERRAEEERDKAHDAVVAAEREESTKEEKRREAEERKQAAIAEAERARDVAGDTADDEAERARADAETTGLRSAPISGATLSSPGSGTPTASDSGTGSQPEVLQRLTAAVDDPEKPERLLGAAFAGAFLLARVLKRIAR